jgi:hypothetical protein
MRFPWHSRKSEVRVASTRVVESRVAPGVTFTIAAMSFARRVELMNRVREIARRMEFQAAGEDAEQKMDAGLLRAEIDRLYVGWGLVAVSGLLVDGREADPALLVEAGPEELFREALAAVRAETGLTEEERKN